MKPPEVDYGFGWGGKSPSKKSYVDEYTTCKLIKSLKPFRKSVRGQCILFGKKCYKVTNETTYRGEIVNKSVRYFTEEEYITEKLKGNTDEWLCSSDG